MNAALTHLNTALDLLSRSTLQAGILILVILGIRFLLRRQLQGRWLFALWFILLVRLGLPWIPASRVSLYGFLPSFHASANEAATPSAPGHARLSPPGSIDAITPVTSPDAFGNSAMRDAGSLSERAFLDVKQAFYLTWLAGMLALGASLLAANIRFLRSIRREPLIIDEPVLRLLEDCKAQMGVRMVLGLVSCDHLKGPALCGFIRPRLLLPRNFLQVLDHAQLRHIFLHELAHLKRHDVLVGWLMSFLQVLHWPNPLVWLGLHRMRLDRELACDDLALSAVAPDTPRDYGRTILRVLESFRQRQYLPALAGIVDNPSQLQERIERIAQPHPPSHRATLSGIALLVGLAFVALTDSPGLPAARANSDSSATPPASAQPGDELEQVQLPEDSSIDTFGHIVDKIDYPFVDDPEAIGKWESVDFVNTIDQFDPRTPRTEPDDLFLKGLVLSEGGRASVAWSGWTKGLLMHGDDKTASRYVIKDIDGTTYMFLEWKSGDYTIRHRKPMYYVLRKLPPGSTRFDNPEELYALDKIGPKAELPPDSYIDSDGRIVDNIDRPFVDDPQVIGRWTSVDFVRNIQDFKPDSPQWDGDLFLKELVFLPGGQMPQPWQTWTNGYVLQRGDHTASQYTVQDVGGATYMFLEWKSGDYSIAHRKPCYYVLKKAGSD